MGDTEVGYTDVPYFACSRELLHFLPRLNVIPIWMVLLQVAGISRRWPVDQIQINVVGAQGLQRGVDAFFDSLVPRIIQFGSQPDLFSRYARVFDSSSNFFLVAISKLRSSQLP